MKVLVTGGSGRVGGYVLRELLERGHALLNFGRTPPLVERVAHLPGDLSDAPAMRMAAQGCDAIVHLAAVAHPRRASPEVVMQSNVMGTFYVLEAAVSAGVSKVVFASTDATLGFAFQQRPLHPVYLPIDEDHPCVPHDEYGLSKVLGEITCKRYSDAYGLRTVCIRINSAWCLDRAGAEVAARSGSLRLSPWPVENLWELYRLQIEHPEGPFPVPGPPAPPTRLWGYTDARDTAQAIRLAVEDAAIGHDVFLTSADDTCARMESAAIAERYYPSVPIRAPLEGHSSLFSHAKATQLLGYRPRHTWRESDFSRWLRERR